MKILGLNISKISAERKSIIRGKLDIKSNIDIKDITKEELDISAKPAYKFSFAFMIDYSPKVASVQIDGAIIVLDDKDEFKDILKDWKKKKFAHPAKVPIFNFILEKCNLKAFQVESDLGLPIHIPLPKLRPQQEQQGNQPANYAG